jgi:hypothetical protein
MTHYPPSPLQERRRLLLRRIGIGLSALMVLTVLVVLGLIVRSESAHDEQACPFTPKSEQHMGEVKVLEEARSCLPEVEERRWLASRPGEAPYELARKRLDKARFSPERFAWSLHEDDAKGLVLRFEIDGALASEIRDADVRRR